MAITIQLPTPVHDGPQFSRLRRSPSPHPHTISAKPKSSTQKAMEAIKNRLAIPRGVVKHWLQFGPRHLDVYPRRYPVGHQSPLMVSRMEGKETTCYEIGLYARKDGHGVEVERKVSSLLNEIDGGNDSDVDLAEAIEGNHRLQVIMKDGGACAWWVM